MRTKFAGAADFHGVPPVTEELNEMLPGLAADNSTPFFGAKVAKVAGAGVGTAGDNRSVGVHVKLLRLFYE